MLRKAPLGKEIEEGDVFSVNDSFSSKFYKVKVGAAAHCICSVPVSYRRCSGHAETGAVEALLQVTALLWVLRALLVLPTAPEWCPPRAAHAASRWHLLGVQVGTISAQKETEPEKLETRQRVEEDRKPQARHHPP